MREIRKIKEGWKHPKKRGKYLPLMNKDYSDDFRIWLNKKEHWDKGFIFDYHSGEWIEKKSWHYNMNFEDKEGTAPDSRDYMPEWKPSEKTHFVLYETLTDGTPVSPAFDTAEQLAEWLTDTRASVWNEFTPCFDDWLEFINNKKKIKDIIY